MANAYTPPETVRARLRAEGQKLTLWGAVLAGGGLAGIIVSMVLKAVFLGILGGPIASLSWLALIPLISMYVPDAQRITDLHALGYNDAWITSHSVAEQVYRAYVRYSNGSGKHQSDRTGDVRGIAITAARMARLAATPASGRHHGCAAA